VASDHRHTRSKYCQQATCRKMASHAGKIAYATAAEPQGIQQCLTHRNQQDYANENGQPVFVPALQNAWPQEIKLLLHAEGP